MIRKGKNKFDRIVKLFKSIYPNLSKQVRYYEPFIFPIIKIELKDGSKMMFDERTCRASFYNNDEDLYKYL